eukprot:Opistho-2@20415
MAAPVYPDLYAKHSWYHGGVSREDATKQLSTTGSFLVRDSSSKTDLVLTVRERVGVKNYVIENKNGKFAVAGGSTHFGSLAALIEHFHNHVLDDSKLSKAINRAPPPGAPSAPPPAVPGGPTAAAVALPPQGPKPGTPIVQYVAEVVCMYNFGGADADELPFVKTEVLKVIEYTTPEWWMAANQQGRRGMIPSNYVKITSQLGPQRVSATDATPAFTASIPHVSVPTPAPTPTPAPAVVVEVVPPPSHPIPPAPKKNVTPAGTASPASARKTDASRLSDVPPPSPKTSASAAAAASDSGRLLSKNEIDSFLDTNFNDLMSELDNL